MGAMYQKPFLDCLNIGSGHVNRCTMHTQTE